MIQIPNSFKNSNTFIITCHESHDLWLVDIGDADSVLSAIGDRNIKGVFLTHAHLDHIYGINDILNKFPECVVYGSRICHEFLHDDRKNLSLYYERPLNLSIEHFQSLSDNSSIQLYDDIAITCFHTPGHTPDSVSYQSGNLLFTGDAFIPGIKTVTKLRGGNRTLADESVRNIMEQISGSTIILAGHGPVVEGASIKPVTG